MTTVARFASHLQQAMGLNPDSVGLPIVESALRTRLCAGGFGNLGEYWEHLIASGTEMQALIDAAVVPETWFFRDREAFAGLVQLVHDRRLRVRPGDRLRLLSLPCASGEEPYSMAMTLLDAGLPVNAFHVEGVDVSVRALERARSAVYGRNSFRGNDLAFRDRYFEPKGSEFVLAKEVRALVDFQHGNLLESRFVANVPAYDFVCCRNLLIYFDRPTQIRAIDALKRLLKADGTLFVGPSESGLFLNTDFASAKLPRAFAFRRTLRAAPEPDAKAVRWRGPQRVRACGAAPTAARPVLDHATAFWSAATAAGSTASGPAVDEIASLADRGCLAEAIQRGEAFLRVHGPSAQVHQLLGLAHDATGMPQEAEQHYRKALYLDPTHGEALRHLALLLERKGDAAAAQRMRIRARREACGGRA